MKKILFVFVVLLLSACQPKPERLLFEREFGSVLDDEAYSVLRMSDGSFLLTGAGDIEGETPYGLLVKLGPSGDELWTLSLDSDLSNYTDYSMELPDGSIVTVGRTVVESAGMDLWVMNISANGDILWERKIGAEGYEGGINACLGHNSNIIVGAYTDSAGAGGFDFWVLELDTEGGLIWQDTYGWLDHDDMYGVQANPDGGYLLYGGTYFQTEGSLDGWLITIDDDGELLGKQTYGSTGWDTIVDLEFTGDGGVLAIGAMTPEAEGDPLDYWAIKLSETAEIEWENTYGGSYADTAMSVCSYGEDSYLIAGRSWDQLSGSEYAVVIGIDSQGTQITEDSFWLRDAEFDFPISLLSVENAGDGSVLLATYRQSEDKGLELFLKKFVPTPLAEDSE